MSSIAVAEISLQTNSPWWAQTGRQQAQDVFVTELVRTKKYTVLTREQLAKRLREKNQTLNSTADAGQVGDVGRAILVDDIVTALFEEYGSVESFRLRSRVVRSSSGQAVWSGESGKLPAINDQAAFDQHARPAIAQLVASLKAAV